MLVDGVLWPEESTSPTGQPVWLGRWVGGGGGGGGVGKTSWMIVCTCLCAVYTSSPSGVSSSHLAPLQVLAEEGMSPPACTWMLCPGSQEARRCM